MLAVVVFTVEGEVMATPNPSLYRAREIIRLANERVRREYHRGLLVRATATTAADWEGADDIERELQRSIALERAVPAKE